MKRICRECKSDRYMTKTLQYGASFGRWLVCFKCAPKLGDDLFTMQGDGCRHYKRKGLNDGSTYNGTQD